MTRNKTIYIPNQKLQFSWFVIFFKHAEIHDHGELDLLLRQLPSELREFVVKPQDNTKLS